MVENIFVSAVLITKPDTHLLAREVKNLSELMSANYSNYEIIVVGNLLPAKELTKLAELLDTTPCIRIVRLSQEYPKDICVFVGLETAIGDVVVVRSPSDPINLLPKFVARTKQADLVFGVSKEKLRRGLLNHYGAKVFYWYNKRFLSISIPENSTYFMALTRRAVNAITRSGRFARHIRYLARQIGYESHELRYRPKGNFLQEKKRFKELLISALELATNYSKHPLRFLSWLGLSASLVNLVYAGYVIWVNISHGHVAEGWTTLSLQAAGMFFLLFAILAILCEYIGRILEETRQDPPYHILDELTSKVSVADATRRNITR